MPRPVGARAVGARVVGRARADEQVEKGEIADRVLLTGALRATSCESSCACRARDAWQLPIRWMAEDGAVVKAGERALEFDNSAFTAQLEEKKLALLEAEIGAAHVRRRQRAR